MKLKSRIMDNLVKELRPNQMLAIFLIEMGKEMPDSITKVDLTELITFLFQKLEWTERNGNLVEVTEEKIDHRKAKPYKTRSTRNQDLDDMSDKEINSNEGDSEQADTKFSYNVPFGKSSNRTLRKSGGSNAPETLCLKNREKRRY